MSRFSANPSNSANPSISPSRFSLSIFRAHPFRPGVSGELDWTRESPVSIFPPSRIACPARKS